MPHQGPLICKSGIYRLIQDCIAKQDLVSGRELHSLLVCYGYNSENSCGSWLIRMYAESGKLLEAYLSFCQVLQPNVRTWSSIIAAHANLGPATRALELYKRMQDHGIKPNKDVFLCMLKACSREGLVNIAQTIELVRRQEIPVSKNILNSLLQGCSKVRDIDGCRILLDFIRSTQFELEATIGDKLIRIFTLCESLHEADQVFEMILEPSTYSWNAIISAHISLGKSEKAVSLFFRMQKEGVQPNQFVFTCTLKACSIMSSLWLGKLLHHQIVLEAMETHVTVGNALLDVYSKCGDISGARNVFDRLPDRDVISWGSMAMGFSQHGFDHAAVELYEDMEKEGAIPNRAIFLHIVKACGNIGALGRGRLIHVQIIKNGLQTDPLIASTLVDMYANCGNLEDLEKVFHGLLTRDIISWGALIEGYAENGNYFLAAQCLENMVCEGVRPDDVIFTSILTACSHAGLLDEGFCQFKFMIKNHGIKPNSTHYNCLIDLLGRLGCLDEAEALIRTMPDLPDIISWKSLLTSCKTHSNTELGRHCFNAAVQSDPHDSAGYVLMSTIYADLDLCQDVDIVYVLKNPDDAAKLPGRAWFGITAKVEDFFYVDQEV